MEEVIGRVVRIASKTLDMDEPDVFFEKKEHFPSLDITSVMLPERLQIYVNENWAEQAEALEVIFTVLHEVRHVYQKRLVEKSSYDDPGITDEDLTQWKKEFDGYTRPDESKAGGPDDAYTKQAIEIDAMAFAKHLISKLFGFEYPVPDELEAEVNNRLARMQHYRVRK